VEISTNKVHAQNFFTIENVNVQMSKQQGTSTLTPNRSQSTRIALWSRVGALSITRTLSGAGNAFIFGSTSNSKIFMKNAASKFNSVVVAEKQPRNDIAEIPQTPFP
jgi:hypothetical protein